MPPLRPFQLERYFARYEFHVEHLLCASDCQSWTVQDLLALEPDAAGRLQQLSLGYTESTGSHALRLAISQIYDTITPEQILVHSGAEEAIFLFMHAVLTAGDHVIVHTPCYQSLAEVPLSIGCQVTRWQGREEAGWALSLDELASLLRADTRLIVLNTPHNPTGYLMTASDFRALNQMAQERGIVLLCDEVYRASEHRPADRLPAACDINPTAVSIGVMSKSYGLPGLRIGWAATQNRTLLGTLAALKDYTTICNSAPSEFLAELALRHRHTLAERNRQIILHNLEILDAFFARHADRFTWQRPQAGPVAFPRLIDNGFGNVEAFCHDLVTRAGVLLLPGSAFDDPHNHFRIGFGRQNLPAAVARLEAYLESAAH
jgi:aspartate/methionine/tyrosine aminotransferase